MASVLLGLLVAALVIAEATHGRGGALLWIRTKFLGEAA